MDGHLDLDGSPDLTVRDPEAQQRKRALLGRQAAKATLGRLRT